MTNSLAKQAAARAAIAYIDDDSLIGVGTGSTVNYFIEALADIKHRITGAVASSEATAERLKALGIPLVDLNSVDRLSLYVDGADEVDPHYRMIKGGGGALTREKIVSAVAERFICIVDETKCVKRLGESFPLPIEVIPMARSFVARELVKLGGQPVYRQGVVTDNGNVILDVLNLEILDPPAMECKINDLPGVVTCGLFALRGADKVIVGNERGEITEV